MGQGCVHAAKPNVLFIMIDDLKPSLGVYGDEQAVTPNMDALVNKGTRFDNMHSSISECAPSRAAMLTGRRNDEIRLWRFRPNLRRYNRRLTTLPGAFRRLGGYRTEAIGKAFDLRSFRTQDREDICSKRNNKYCSWDWFRSFKNLRDTNICGQRPEYFPGKTKRKDSRFLHLIYNYSDNSAPLDIDHCIASVAVSRLKHLASNAANKKKPFFLAIGFAKPHMPWTYPESVHQIFASRDDSLFEPPTHEPEFWTDHSSKWSMAPNREMLTYIDHANFSTPQRVKGYYAAVTFVDQQIGRIMDTFNNDINPSVRDNTIIVLWGDHGFHLGDRNMWGKKTNFDTSTRIPFAIVPSKNFIEEKEIAVGSHVVSPTDSVDIYPTLMELCKLRTRWLRLSGSSLVSLLYNPRAAVRSAAISQFQANGKSRFMGYSIRTTHHRLIIYVKRSLRGRIAFFKNKVSSRHTQLYHYTEPGGIERVNHFRDPAYADAAKQLMSLFLKVKDKSWSHLLGKEPFDHSEEHSRRLSTSKEFLL